MKRLLRRVLTSVLSVAVVAYVGAVGFLTLRENALVYAGAQRSGKGGAVPRDTLTVPWDTVSVTASDGVRVLLLESRVRPASADAPETPRTPEAPEALWILYLHGNGSLIGDRGAVSRYRIFRDLGFNVLAVEYRGYGDSGRTKPSEEGVYADARAGWKHLTVTLGVAPDRILVYGWSLGSGVATQLATEVRPAGLVTEGTFTSLPAAARDVYPWVPTGLLMRNRFDNLSKAGRVRAPWLLLHGRHDREVRLTEGQEVAAAANARLVPLEAGHDALLGDRAGAEAALRAFADSVLGGAAPGPAAGVRPDGTSGSKAR